MTFATFLTDVLTLFLFVVWFWLLIIVFSDLFRRDDVSGWGKALWVIVLILFPYLGVFMYMILQAKGMAERSSQQARRTREELRRVVGFRLLMRSRSSISLRHQDRSRRRSLSVFVPGWLTNGRIQLRPSHSLPAAIRGEARQAWHGGRDQGRAPHVIHHPVLTLAVSSQAVTA